MKRYLTVVFALAFILSSTPITVCYAAPNHRETMIERTGDWFATLGKEGPEKARIIAERRSERAVDRVEKIARKAAEQAEKYNRDRKKRVSNF